MTVSASAWITRASLLDYMEISGVTNSQGQILDAVINGITRKIQQETGRKFRHKPASGLGSYNPTGTPDDSIYDGTGSGRLFLVNYPIVSVATLQTTYVINSGVKDVATINSDDYRLIKEHGIIELVRLPEIPHNAFLEHPQSVEVNYKAGYGATTFPDDLKLAAYGYAEYLWRYSRKKDPSLTEERMHDGTWFKYDTKMTRPGWVSEIIESYRRLNM
jgi:hypothetical protein